MLGNSSFNVNESLQSAEANEREKNLKNVRLHHEFSQRIKEMGFTEEKIKETADPNAVILYLSITVALFKKWLTLSGIASWRTGTLIPSKVPLQFDAKEQAHRIRFPARAETFQLLAVAAWLVRWRCQDDPRSLPFFLSKTVRSRTMSLQFGNHTGRFNTRITRGHWFEMQSGTLKVYGKSNSGNEGYDVRVNGERRKLRLVIHDKHSSVEEEKMETAKLISEYISDCKFDGDIYTNLESFIALAKLSYGAVSYDPVLEELENMTRTRNNVKSMPTPREGDYAAVMLHLVAVVVHVNSILKSYSPLEMPLEMTRISMSGIVLELADCKPWSAEAEANRKFKFTAGHSVDETCWTPKLEVFYKKWSLRLTLPSFDDYVDCFIGIATVFLHNWLEGARVHEKPPQLLCEAAKHFDEAMTTTVTTTGGSPNGVKTTTDNFGLGTFGNEEWVATHSQPAGPAPLDVEGFVSVAVGMLERLIVDYDERAACLDALAKMMRQSYPSSFSAAAQPKGITAIGNVNAWTTTAGKPFSAKLSNKDPSELLLEEACKFAEMQMPTQQVVSYSYHACVETTSDSYTEHTETDDGNCNEGGGKIPQTKRRKRNAPDNERQSVGVTG